MTAEQKATIQHLWLQGKSYSEIASAVGTSWDAARNYVRRHKAAWPSKAAYQETAAADDAVSAERDRAKMSAQVALLKQLVSKRAVIEEWRDAIHEAALAVDPPELIAAAREHSDFDPEAAVLIISDVHVGQHTPGRINGGYTQTMETTRAQFTRLGKALLRIWDIQRRSTPWHELVILDLGDDVEGDNMRASQHRIVDPLVVQQVTAYGRLLSELVLTALQVFETVRIERVPGNHGRTSQKAGNAGLAELDPIDSFDWLAGEFTREILSEAISQGRVTLDNHDSYYGVTEVAGHRVVFEHGASLRGGASWGGIPYYGVDRAAAAYRDLEGDYTVLALGHFHRPYDLPSAYGGIAIGNGAFPPTTPFVVASKHRATRPSQTLLSMHAKQGVTMIRRLYI